MLVWLKSLVNAFSPEVRQPIELFPVHHYRIVCIVLTYQDLYVLRVFVFSLASLELSEKQCKELDLKLKAREEFLLPIYHQVAVQFVDLHDTPGRMQEKGVISVSVHDSFMTVKRCDTESKMYSGNMTLPF